MTDLFNLLELLKTPTLETLYMVFLSSVFAILMGMPMGIILYLTEDGGLYPNKSPSPPPPIAPAMAE
jgi:D-methionine transport system permease protein